MTDDLHMPGRPVHLLARSLSWIHAISVVIVTRPMDRKKIAKNLSIPDLQLMDNHF